jgi:anti-sigma factor RsiW
MPVRAHFSFSDVIIDHGMARSQVSEGERAPGGVAASSEHTIKTALEIRQQVELQEEDLMWEQ